MRPAVVLISLPSCSSPGRRAHLPTCALPSVSPKAPSFRAACVPQSSSAVVRLAYLHLSSCSSADVRPAVVLISRPSCSSAVVLISLPSCSSLCCRAHLPAVVLICRRAHLPLLICQLAPSRQSHRAVCAQPSVTHSAQLEWLAIRPVIRPVIWLAIPIVTAFTYLSHPTVVVLHGRRLAVKCHHCSPHIP